MLGGLFQVYRWVITNLNGDWLFIIIVRSCVPFNLGSARKKLFLLEIEKKNFFISILFQQENSSCSSKKKNSSFQSCFSPYLGS
jgi:hypothetical protein